MLGFGCIGEFALGEIPPQLSEAAIAAAAAEASRNRGAPRTGGWETERLYLPPGKWTRGQKKKALDAVRKLYKEAQDTIPEHLQVGLVPEIVLRARRSNAALPKAEDIDFGALAQSVEALRVLVAAVDAAREQKRLADEARTKKRRRDEEAFLMLLGEYL